MKMATALVAMLDALVSWKVSVFEILSRPDPFQLEATHRLQPGAWHVAADLLSVLGVNK